MSKYILLTDADVIEEYDEILQNDGETWCIITTGNCFKLTIGKHIKRFNSVRRNVKRNLNGKLKKYRVLEPCEILEEFDEYLCWDGDTWKQIFCCVDISYIASKSAFQIAGDLKTSCRRPL